MWCIFNVGPLFSTNAESSSILISTHAERILYPRRAVSPDCYLDGGGAGIYVILLYN